MASPVSRCLEQDIPSDRVGDGGLCPMVMAPPQTTALPRERRVFCKLGPPSCVAEVSNSRATVFRGGTQTECSHIPGLTEGGSSMRVSYARRSKATAFTRALTMPIPVVDTPTTRPTRARSVQCL